MKKFFGLVVAFIMAFTVFFIPGFSALAYADDEESNGEEVVGTMELGEPEPEPAVPSVTNNKASVNKVSVTITWDLGENTDGAKVQIEGFDEVTVEGTTYSKSGLAQNTTYNYTITPYKTDYAGEEPTPVTGKFTTYTTKSGWYKVGNFWTYYDSNGKMVKNDYRALKSKTGNYKLYHYFDASGKWVGRSPAMYNAVKSRGSKKYIVAVDRVKNVVCVYQGKAGSWYPIKYWSCVTGDAKHKTPKGVFKVRSKKKTFSGYGVPEKKRNRYSVWHCTKFTGSVFFHSQLYKYRTKSKFIPGGGAMGSNASHGCVRLSIQYAKWIYSNLAKGSTVVVMETR